MTAQPGLGVTGNGVGVTTPIAHRLAQAGLVAKAGGTPNLVRAGLFYDGTSNIVTGTAGMSYDVAAFTAALTRGAGQGTVLLANDGTVNVPTIAAPGSNSRIDIVYVWQRDFAIDGTDSNPVIGVVQGSPAASPAAPSLAAFPGALELARITVPAGVTATNTGTTITQRAMFTAAAGGVIVARTTAEMQGFGPQVAPGQQVYVLETQSLFYKFEAGGDFVPMLTGPNLSQSSFGSPQFGFSISGLDPSHNLRQWGKMLTVSITATKPSGNWALSDIPFVFFPSYRPAAPVYGALFNRTLGQLVGQAVIFPSGDVQFRPHIGATPFAGSNSMVAQFTYVLN